MKNPIEIVLANNSYVENHTNFWFNSSKRSQEEIQELLFSQAKDGLEITRKLISYVPKLVVRRLFNNAQAIQVTISIIDSILTLE